MINFLLLVEVFLWWNCDGENIFFVVFIFFVECSGLMLEIGVWVLNRVFIDFLYWWFKFGFVMLINVLVV